ncbi:hypothetical protein NDU88_004828 [Pleurodeles waltl]|uniref:Uncharacterized protein n=1 Tax=Pleurodeles waltl TaxID=8319 RepID=A0AAV7VJU2_PLEWA|nr:hypothetical protein NDU88_004828 [Pleurodeles waltl]
MCNQTSKQYFLDNQGSVASSEVIWEAQKTYLRGEIISDVKDQRERSRQKIQDLEGRIMDLEGRYVEQEQETRQDLLHSQKLLQQELTQEARAAWRTT